MNVTPSLCSLRRALVGLAASALALAACDSTPATPAGDAGPPDAGPAPRVPLDPSSPWPKFRANARQDGRSTATPRDDGSAPWVFRTGKGIFSTPVIDGEGNVYVGSADRVFYAITPEGRERWRVRTGEIIDSSALLDDRGRVYVGSGDGYLYAIERASGNVVWRFQADDPMTNNAFIRWFEGNVAITADGTLVAPNDNFCTYGIDRETGARRWCFRTSDQTWALPALDARTGRLFLGNNFLLGPNVFAIDGRAGAALWRATVPATVAASPMLLGEGDNARVVAGGFDGFVRTWRAGDGTPGWTFGARDHLYASPAALSDGTVIQASADGTIYALDGADGRVRWSFDALEPIRSSPAIDAMDRVYVGSGEGRLFVLNPDGTLRWSMRLIDEARNDLNASVALGARGAVIAGENGGVFFVPYDYCLRDAAMADARCRRGPGEDLPREGAFLYRTTRFGNPVPDTTATIDANEPVAFSLFVRANGDTRLAHLDTASVQVTLEPPSAVQVQVSGDRRFLVVVPEREIAAGADGHVRLRVRGSYRVDPARDGLRFSGGTIGGTYDTTLDLAVRPPAPGALALPFPSMPGDRAAAFELYRVAAPLPTILPSYNQIGFDSIHYILGVVEGTPERAVAWGVGAVPNDAGDGSVVDPVSSVRFPLVVSWTNGRLTASNNQRFSVDFNGFALPFESFRVSTRTDAMGVPQESPTLVARAVCGQIDFYGAFLRRLGFCNPDTDVLLAFGATEMRLHRGGSTAMPEGAGTVALTVEGRELRASYAASTLRASEHNFGVLALDPATGAPRNFDYVRGSSRAARADGVIERVTQRLPDDFHGAVRVYAMVDSYPVARAMLTVP